MAFKLLTFFVAFLKDEWLADFIFGEDVQLEEAEKRLKDAESKLARLRANLM